MSDKDNKVLSKSVVYHSEFYNKSNETEQWIRLSDGCYRNCWNCYCPKHKLSYEIPGIIRNKVVILDMNFLYAYQNPLKALLGLGEKKVNNRKVYYDFYCGLDYGLLTQPICNALKKGGFGRFNNKRNYIRGLRIAWDRSVREQKIIKKAIDRLNLSGYNPKLIQIFILANGKVPFKECRLKLDLMKVWNVQVADCWYDNQKRGSVKPVHWTDEECKNFGKLCRKHNHLVAYGIDPELKGANYGQ